MLSKQLGETAGRVWSVLRDKGPLSVSTIKKQVKAPGEMVLMAIGWLAREDKLVFEQKGRVQLVRLR
jgi:hypothetical protein